jgi:hypothetical protein
MAPAQGAAASDRPPSPRALARRSQGGETMSAPPIDTTPGPRAESYGEVAEIEPPASIGMMAVRYGLGGVMVLGGIVLLVINPGGVGADGFAMAVGGGLSVLMLNFMFRLSVSSESDREREEEARRYFDEHGEWPPDEAEPQGRKWVLAPGVVTYEQEQAELAARRAAAERRAAEGASTSLAA